MRNMPYVHPRLDLILELCRAFLIENTNSHTGQKEQKVKQQPNSPLLNEMIAKLEMTLSTALVLLERISGKGVHMYKGVGVRFAD